MAGHSKLGHTMLDHTMPDHTMVGHTMPNHIKLGHTTLPHTMPGSHYAASPAKQPVGEHAGLEAAQPAWTRTVRTTVAASPALLTTWNSRVVCPTTPVFRPHADSPAVAKKLLLLLLLLVAEEAEVVVCGQACTRAVMDPSMVSVATAPGSHGLAAVESPCVHLQQGAGIAGAQGSRVWVTRDGCGGVTLRAPRARCGGSWGSGFKGVGLWVLLGLRVQGACTCSKYEGVAGA